MRTPTLQLVKAPRLIRLQRQLQQTLQASAHGTALFWKLCASSSGRLHGMVKMAKTYRQEARPRLRPRQLKRQKLKELLQWDRPQPDLRPEPVHYKPLG